MCVKFYHRIEITIDLFKCHKPKHFFVIDENNHILIGQALNWSKFNGARSTQTSPLFIACMIGRVLPRVSFAHEHCVSVCEPK